MPTDSERERLEREYAEAGHDLSLLDARLRMTPQQRVEAHESALALALALRAAGEALRQKDREALRELETIRARLRDP